MRAAARLAASLLAAAAPVAPATAASYYALRYDALELWRIDATTFQAALVGPFVPATPGEFGIAGLAEDESGALFGVSGAFLQGATYRFDLATGAAHAQHVLAQPTGSQGMAFQPGTGLLYWLNLPPFANAPELVSFDPATQSLTNHGVVADGLRHFSGLAFDPAGILYAMEFVSQTLWIVDPAAPAGPGTHAVGPLGPQVDAGDGGGLIWDEARGTLVGYAKATHALFTVDPGSGAATLLHAFPAGVPPLFALAGGDCDGAVVPYGVGCAAAGGGAPLLIATGCARAGETLAFTIADGAPGATALLALGLVPAQAPLGGGCSLLVGPSPPPFVPVPLDAAGGATIVATLPPAFAGLAFTLQTFVPDAAVPIGAAASRGLQIVVE